MAAKDSELWIKASQALTAVPSEYTTVKELVRSAGSPSNSSYMLQEQLIGAKRSSDRRSIAPHVRTTIHNTDEMMAQYVRTPNDTNDPSYTHSVVCRQRYRNAAKQQKADFIKEIQAHELLAEKALDGVRIHRSQQSGFISIFYSVGSNPLALWDKQVKNGHIRRVIDDEVKSLVLDIGGTNVATTYITCPIKPRAALGIKLPYLVMVIKNMKKYFSFEIQILDDKDMRRRFRVSNFQSTTKVRPFCTTMPIGLSAGWNQVQFNLADFTKRAYGSVYLETVRVQIHANVRIRRIYFTDQLHSDDELPNEFKLFAPGPREQTKGKTKDKKSSKETMGKYHIFNYYLTI
ncbi:hypothetical protein D910_10792 [Dendroctonus ponderosae]|uniref:CFA20 domain-containing protein n=1 Tax=Dendroctonus ponderosae TaxID=77166 RepID=U4UM02_DENPD|nr:hypothetical protein D910_10792 [Dendroctonus ponderosae]